MRPPLASVDGQETLHPHPCKEQVIQGEWSAAGTWNAHGHGILLVKENKTCSTKADYQNGLPPRLAHTFWVVILHCDNLATCGFCIGDDGGSIQRFNSKQVNDTDRNIWKTAITSLVYQADLD